LREANKQQKTKLQKLKGADKPKCEYFPESEGEEIKCKKAGIILKIRSFFDFIQDKEVIACVGFATLRAAATKIISKVTDIILDKILNILGSFVYAGIKIVYFVIKMFHQFWKLGDITSKIKPNDNDAKKKKDTKGKSQALGAALGYGYRVVKSVVEMVGGKKKNRHLKKLI